MKARSRISDPLRPARPMFRTSLTNFLMLGFLAGLVTANFVPAVQLSLTTTLAIAGLIVSLLFSQLSYYCTIKAERKASHQALRRIEQRMERHIKAHGTHAHSPHNKDGEPSEKSWTHSLKSSLSQN